MPGRSPRAVVTFVAVLVLALAACTSTGGDSSEDIVEAVAVSFDGFEDTAASDAAAVYEDAADSFRSTVSIDGSDVSPDPSEVRSEARRYRGALFDLDAAVRAEAPPSVVLNAFLEAAGGHIASLDELMVAQEAADIVEAASAAAETGPTLRTAGNALAAELAG